MVKVYVIIVYDVSIKRVNKICQFLRQYMNWVQNSVFEGELSESEFKQVENKIKKLINFNEDSIIVYKLKTEKFIERSHIGTKKAEPSLII